MKFIANLISVVFHPLLMVFYSTVIAFYGYDLIPNLGLNYQAYVWGLILFFSFVLPSIFIVMMFRYGLISNVRLSDRKDRILPYVFTSLLYVFIAYQIYNKTLFDPFIYKTFLFGAFVILVSAIINMKFKISSHAISCASILGMLLHLSLYYDGQYQFMLLVGVLLITGGVSSARLYLKAHDSFEILAGLSLGLLLGIISPFMIL